MSYFSCPDKTNATACSKGTFAGPGQTVCTVCPVGHFCPTQKLSAPKPCPLGTYANDTQQDSCTSCSSAHSCSNTSVDPVLCEEGYYSEGGRSECLPCPAGFR